MYIFRPDRLKSAPAYKLQKVIPAWREDQVVPFILQHYGVEKYDESMSSIFGAVEYHPDNQESEHFQWVQGIDISEKHISSVSKKNKS